jgi:hypothetical protein
MPQWMQSDVQLTIFNVCSTLSFGQAKRGGSLSKIRSSFGEAFWEWLPGVIAGGLPLMIFMLFSDRIEEHHGLSNLANEIVRNNLTVSEQAPKEIASMLQNHAEHSSQSAGWSAHMLIFAIANSTVSVTTFFSRLIRRQIPNIDTEGRGPLALFLGSLAVLVYVTSLYASLETKGHLPWGGTKASIGLVLSLLASLYMEIMIARLHELARQRRIEKRNSRQPPNATPGD